MPRVGVVWADAWKLYGGEARHRPWSSPSAPRRGQQRQRRGQRRAGGDLSGRSRRSPKVEYLIDGVLVATATASPWSASWSAAGWDAHALKGPGAG